MNPEAWLAGAVVLGVLVWPGRWAGTRRHRPRRESAPAPVAGHGPSARPEDAVHGRPQPWSAAWRAQRADGSHDDSVAEILELVVAPVRAGVPPAGALQAALAVGDGPLTGLVETLVAASTAGEAVAPVWLAHATRLDNSALRFVGQAWALSERTGAPLADALDTAIGVLRERRRARDRLAAAVAGPRASMAVLCLLPLSGPVVGLACGVGPAELYLGSVGATASAAVGLVLGCLAMAWSRRILARAT